MAAAISLCNTWRSNFGNSALSGPAEIDFMNNLCDVGPESINCLKLICIHHRFNVTQQDEVYVGIDHMILVVSSRLAWL